MTEAETTSDPVRAYYATFAEREWQRLEDPARGTTEWALITRRIARHLETLEAPDPAAPLRILDIGGGPGRYTIWLAEQDYQGGAQSQRYLPTLADLSPELLAIAGTKITEAGLEDRVEAIIEADATDLSAWDDASFDAALSLGPFYHLPDEAQRTRAAAELARVLRPGGLAFVAFMPRLALLSRTIALPDERHHLLDDAWLNALLDDGHFTNDIPGRFGGAYAARVEEIAPFMESAGFETLSLSSAQSITRGLEPALEQIATAPGDLHPRLLDLLDTLAEDPTTLGLANHLLYIGRRTH